MTDVSIGALTDLPADAGRRIDVGQARVAVFKVGDEVYAIGDRCSHAEASLAEGEVVGTEVECPRHGAIFDVTSGEPLSLPATKPVPVYPVTVTDGEVVVTIATESEEAPS